MKKLVLFLLIALSSVVQASSPSKVYLLTSIDESTLKGPFFLHWGYFEHYVSGLEGQFQTHFKNSPYQAVVIHHASRADLFEVLHDPQAVGVFWLSHGAPLVYGKGMGKQSPQILDATGADVKDLFYSIHPGIRWVSVVGCDSSQILKTEHGNLFEVHSFNTITDASKGLAQAMNSSDAVLNQTGAAPSSCIHEKGREIEVTRTLKWDASLPKNYEFPSATVEFHGVDLAAFGAMSMEQVGAAGGTISETKNVWLPMAEEGLKSSQDLELVINAALGVVKLPKGFTLGDYAIRGSWEEADWKLEPIGISTKIFRYAGPLQIQSPSQDFTPFFCE